MFGKTQRGVSERPNKPKKPLIPAWLGTLVDHFNHVKFFGCTHALETLGTV